MLKLDQQQMPEDLLQLANPVKQLYVIGSSFNELMAMPRLAIIGSRRVSPYGRSVTENLTNELASKGVVIISGLALGTDSIAHQACLNSGGKTIAVLPCGLDKIYPRTHTNLAREIIKKGGAIISEQDFETIPYKTIFLERNRIIAGLSEGVLVTEAAIRSGSLNTANHALQLGKPVFAVPGNITNPLSAGCNNLIKAGAIPVTCVQDILDALKWKDLTAKPKAIFSNNDSEAKILSLMSSGVNDGYELLTKSNLEASEFNQTMTMLEITGRIHPNGANHWSL